MILVQWHSWWFTENSGRSPVWLHYQLRVFQREWLRLVTFHSVQQQNTDIRNIRIQKHSTVKGNWKKHLEVVFFLSVFYWSFACFLHLSNCAALSMQLQTAARFHSFDSRTLKTSQSLEKASVESFVMWTEKKPKKNPNPRKLRLT